MTLKLWASRPGCLVRLFHGYVQSKATDNAIFLGISQLWSSEVF
ncbi:hypothetical protein [Nodosilinea sp. E11]|nr:hypothetical protein [Nodosilinea sp. E11]WOD37543.1 hypothetical protein RRF56_15140 [Nodosilinea sp. E11]